MISVTADGRWSVAGRPVALPEIEQMIREGSSGAPEQFSVQIRGDREARYEFIEPLLIAAARHKVLSVRFHVVAP